MFVCDENNDQYKAKINGVVFVCDSMQSDYEKRVRELAEHYEKKLPLIVEYINPDIREIFGISDLEVIRKSLGRPAIDLSRGDINLSGTYDEQSAYHLDGV